MTTETTAYLTEAEAPTIQTRADARAGLLAFLNISGGLAQQIGAHSRQLTAARLTETDPAIAGLFEEHRQTLGALEREVREAEQEIGQVVVILRQYESVVARLREAVDAAAAPVLP